MNEIVSVAVQSVAKEKIRHITNAGAGGGALALAPEWLGIAGGVMALLVSCAIFYKTYQEIRINRLNEQLAKIELAKKGARSADKG